jgi:tripeptidyl-peptidase-1
LIASVRRILTVRIEYAMGIATNVPTYLLSVGGSGFNKALLDTTTYLASMPNPPSVMSTSYGANERHLSRRDAQ